MKNFVKLILIILAVLFAIYVWPTPYKYMNIDGGQPFRMHRITGKGELWFRSVG